MKTGTCPGCLRPKALVSSHLVSRAVYDYLRTNDLHPFVAARRAVRATSDQLQADLLCEDCEQMLNEDGERWILGKLCTIDRKFPLYDLLRQQAPIDTGLDGETFAAATNPSIDVQSVTHFGLGVFWKASLYPWEIGRISLGAYEDPIRTWLRGETAFPQNVALNVILSRPSTALIIMNPPYQTTKVLCHTYLFHVPGVLFRLSVGKEIPSPERTLCFYSSAQHFIVVSDTTTKKILRANVEGFNESTKTKSYQKARAKLNKLQRKS